MMNETTPDWDALLRHELLALVREHQMQEAMPAETLEQLGGPYLTARLAHHVGNIILIAENAPFCRECKSP